MRDDPALGLSASPIAWEIYTQSYKSGKRGVSYPSGSKLERVLILGGS